MNTWVKHAHSPKETLIWRKLACGTDEIEIFRLAHQEKPSDFADRELGVSLFFSKSPHYDKNPPRMIS